MLTDKKVNGPRKKSELSYLVGTATGRLDYRMAFRFTLEHLQFFMSEELSLVNEEFRGQTEKYGDSLRIQTALRKRFPELPPSLLHAAIELFELRSLAVAKCGLPPACLCTRDTLEMASSLPVARLHADLLPSVGRILDCCSGIGSDALRFAEKNEVLCIEVDPMIARMCRNNLHLADADGAVFVGRAETWLPGFRDSRIAAVFADPARRSASLRFVEAEQGSPPLSFFLIASAGLPLLVKVAPAAAVDARTWGRIFVASGRECKEQLAHRGLDLPALCVIHAGSGTRWTPALSELPVVNNPAWLIEPHNAVVLSGAVAEYMHEYGAVPIDPQIAYGLAEEKPPTSPLHQTFRILRFESFNRKRLRAAVKELNFGPGTEIKKRGFPQTPEQLRAELPLTGTHDGVILIARRGDGHAMVFAERERHVILTKPRR